MGRSFRVIWTMGLELAEGLRPVIGVGRHADDAETGQDQACEPPAVTAAGVDTVYAILPDQRLAVVPVVQVSHDEGLRPVIELVPGAVVTLGQVLLARKRAGQDGVALPRERHARLP